MGRRRRLLLLVLTTLSFFLRTSLQQQQQACTALELFTKGLDAGSTIPTWQFNSSSPSIGCCRWHGVLCDGNGSVTELRLASMGLKGYIANNSLGSLHHLAHLDLSNNSLTGLVPSDIFVLSELLSLNLSMNQLNGTLPSTMSLPSIQILDVSFNDFSGPLPASLFESTSLRTLQLHNNGFTGSLSSRIGDLVLLKELDISSNSFSATIPDVFDRLKYLEFLSFASNNFVGNLPSTLSSLSSIEFLNLNKNSLVGRIQLNFSNMLQLTSLDLGSNYFNGSIPLDLSSCVKLKTINLARNALTGEIPKSFMNLTSLQFLSLSNNSFTNITSALETLQYCPSLTTLVVTINFKGDPLPYNGIVGFKVLRLLVAANCGLSGLVPQWLSKCGNLQLLDLSWNKLHGTIPTWFGEFKSLFYVDLSNNTLAGEFPVNLTQLPALVHGNSAQNGSSSAFFPFFSKQGNRLVALQYNQLSSFPPTLDLSYNNLSGPIPHELGNLKKLHILHLNNNNFTGPIPDELSSLSALEVLDLSNNHLNGTIPSSLSNLTFLAQFNVSYNNLVGSIPASTQFLTFNSSSYEGNAGLCGLPLAQCGKQGGYSPTVLTRKKSINRGAVAGIALAVGLGMTVLLFFVYLALMRVRSRKIEDSEGDLGLDFHRNIEQSGSSVVLLFQPKEPNSLSVDDILKSTNNFDQANIIGCGGFGLVYKATLPNGFHVAIKRLSGEFGQMEREFQAEVETLSRAQHVNLVLLQGYCLIGNDRLLIYSFMENGSLDYWLHENDRAKLDWPTRLRIARGAARGLAYLHQSCDPHILHRDIKSSNILLDSRFEAHLADFGLARLMLPSDTHVSTDLVGTLGYIPPEYAQSPVATMKGDVYSFGVVLLELLTGRRPMDMCRPKETRDLISWAVRMRDEGRESEVFDSSIYDKDCGVVMGRVLEISCRCLRENPKERPWIQQIVAWLDDVETGVHSR